MKHSLSIYRISMTKRRKRDDKIILSDIMGKDFLNLTNDFINNTLVGPSNITDSTVENKVCRIGSEGGVNRLHIRNRIIDGIIESGEYGQEIGVINVADGSPSKTIQKDEAPMLPFYFCFFIPKEEYSAYLILQKSGNNGIYSIFITLFRRYLTAVLDKEDYTLSINPFALPVLIDNNLSFITEAKTISIKNKGLDILKEIGLGMLDTSGAMSEITFNLGKNRFFDVSAWLPKMLNRDSASDDNMLTYDEGDISMDVKLPDGSTQRLNMARLSAIGTNMTLDKGIEIDSKGFPKFESIRDEAMKLIDCIEKNIGSSNEKE